MSKLLNRSQICSGLVACILIAGFLIPGGAVKPALAQACDKAGGKLGGAVIGGAMGARRDRKRKARCLEERRVEQDRNMQRQLDYDRQRLLQQEQVRKEIEEQRLYDEWKKERLQSSG